MSPPTCIAAQNLVSTGVDDIEYGRVHARRHLSRDRSVLRPAAGRAGRSRPGAGRGAGQVGPLRGEPDGLEASGGMPDGVRRDHPRPGRRGLVDAVGAGVDALGWGTGSGWCSPSTAGRTAPPPSTPCSRASQVVPLPDDASYDLGASVGVPAVTAHRALTSAEVGPSRLGPGSTRRQDRAGGRGSGRGRQRRGPARPLGGATVVTTVSSEEKAALARAAGAHHVVNYRDTDAAKGSSRSRRTGWTSPSRSPPPRTSASTWRSCACTACVDLRQQRRRRADDALRAASGRTCASSSSSSTRSTTGGPGRDRGRHDGGRGGCAAGRRGRRAPLHHSRWRNSPRPTTPSRAARSARCCSTSPTHSAWLS